MSTDTTPGGLPFPLGDDPVAEGHDRIRELAEAIGAHGLVAAAAGTANLGATAANGGNASVVVTFPAGLFTRLPGIALTAHYRLNPAVNAISATAGTFAGYNFTGIDLASSLLRWVAVQADPAAALAAREAGPLVPATATCTTDDCDNAGAPIAVDLGWLDDDGLLQQVDPANVLCGVCGQQCEVTA